MANIDKAAIADLFRRPDACIWLIIATKAFGLGMNIPDVSFVCILGCPSLVSDFYQWIGRAGRNGRRSYAFLYFKRVDMSSTDTSMMDICAGGEFMPGCVWDKLNAIFSPRYQRQARPLLYDCCNFCDNTPLIGVGPFIPVEATTRSHARLHHQLTPTVSSGSPGHTPTNHPRSRSRLDVDQPNKSGKRQLMFSAT